jgi:hypothetical protein
MQQNCAHGYAHEALVHSQILAPPPLLLTLPSCSAFSRNGLSGTIPSSIGELTAVTAMYLDNNELTGRIPSEIAKLKKLAYL